MRVFRGLPAEADQSVALTIGNFDGVHRGHQAMLSRLIEAAEDLALPPAVMTFEPHPREFFAHESAPPRLSSLRAKLERFADLGVDRVYVARFDARLAALTPEVFIGDVLVRRLGARWLLVGEDFRFGKGRSGDLSTLRIAARVFSVEAMRTVGVEGERASSSAVRRALAEVISGTPRRCSAALLRLAAASPTGPSSGATWGFRRRISGSSASHRCRVYLRCGSTVSTGLPIPVWRAWACVRPWLPPANRCSKCSSSISTL